VTDFIYPSDSTPEYSSILVPNIDSVRTEFLISTIAKQRKAVLLIGEQGTAKTVIVNRFVAQYDREVHVHKAVNFSSATTPLIFQASCQPMAHSRIILFVYCISLINSYFIVQIMLR